MAGGRTAWAALSSLAAAALVATAVVATSDGLDVAIGKAVFDRMWTQAPASTTSADGLGPLFAARSCASCHAGGGRTTFRLGRDDPAAHPGLVIRFGDREGRPDPVYGRQLQPDGLGLARGEGHATVRFASAKPGAAARLEWRVDGLTYGALAPATRASPRVAPSLDGLGEFSRVADAAILAREDLADVNGDGVSGRAARLASGEIGRFGWKAAEATLETQSAAAFALDIGLSTTLRLDPAGDCTAAQDACRAAPQGASGGEAEIDPRLMASLLAFLDRKPAPPTSTASPRGARVFASTGCASCHAPALPLAGGGEARAFTDLLLHDLGPDLDDGMGEGAAASAEWRTAPLWGLSRTLAREAGLMHDGRAATVADAIGWHGGEASGARARFQALKPAERLALLDYVNGL